MATETENTTDTGQNTLTVSLAMIAGLGMTLMMVAAGIGVIGGEQADGSTFGLMFVGGLALFVLGLGGWLGVVRPWETFDDINQPHYTGHHHHDEDYTDQEPGEVNVEEPIPPQTTST